MSTLLTIVPHFLRNPAGFFEEIAREENLGSKNRALVLSGVLFFTTFGFVTGLSHSPMQALSAAVKMPILFMATILICLPAFYFFSLVLGTRLSISQVAAVTFTGVGVSALLLLGLAPITLFFVITSGSYPFFQLLAVAFVGLSGSIGMCFIWRGMVSIDPASGDSQNLRHVLLWVWFALFGFVGSQMTWRLSPLIGDPTTEFVLLRPSRDNFYVDVANAFSRLFNLPSVPWVNTIVSVSLCVTPFILVFLGVVIWSATRRQPAPANAT